MKAIVHHPVMIREDRTAGVSELSVVCGGALLAAAVFFNEANFRSVDVEDFSFDWQIALRLGICGLCGLFGLAHLDKTTSYLRGMPGILGLILVGWAFVTVPFAVNPVYAAAAATSVTCFVLAAPAMLVALGSKRFLQVTLVALFAYLAGSWLVYFAIPDLGRMHDVDGIIRFGGLNHPNTTGRQSALTIGLALVAGHCGAVRWKYLVPLMGLAAFTLLLTDSRTATCAALAAVALFAYRRTDFVTKYVLVYGAIAAAVCWFAFLRPEVGQTLSGLSRSGEAEEIVTLTGRTDLWRFAIEKLAQSPVFGYGYGCSRFVIAAEHYWPTHHAHNVVLNMMLGTGILGGVILLSMFWELIRNAIAAPRYFPDVILVLVLVGGIADAVMFLPIPDSHTLMWLSALAWRPLSDTLQLRDLELT